MLSNNLYVKGCLDCTVGAFRVSIPAEPSLFQYEVQVFNAERASSSVDLILAVSCGLTLHICLIIALSFRCRRWRLDFVIGQVSLAWSIALRTQELFTRHVSSEKGGGKRTGISSLNFFQAVFTRVVVESSQPPAAESMSPR